MTYEISPGPYGADVKKDGELFAMTFCEKHGGDCDKENNDCVASMTQRAEEIVRALNAASTPCYCCSQPDCTYNGCRCAQEVP